MPHLSYSALARKFGYPLYIYDEGVITSRLAMLRETFPDFGLLYSMKTNPNPSIYRFMADQGLGIDAASSFEVKKALEAGFEPDRIFYSAPGKTGGQLADALGKCVITADSYTELLRLEHLADASPCRDGKPLPVGLRINPDLAFGPGEFPELLPGVSSKFGVDEESLAGHWDLLAASRRVRISGIHVFLRSQVLSQEALAACFKKIFMLAKRCREEFGWDLDFINFGGGLGIPAPGSDAETGRIDLDRLRLDVCELVSRYRTGLPGCRFLLESGRFLVGEAGTFVTRIEDVKESRGKTYVIAPGGLSGFFRPSVMNLLNALPFPVSGPYEPLFSNGSAHKVSLTEKTAGEPKKVTVCGNLCTALDVMAQDVLLPDPQPGDILTISNAGAYAATLSPVHFASFPKPVELYRRSDGKILSAG